MSTLRRVTCAAVFVLTSLLSLAPLPLDAPPDAPERFATELRACSEATAAERPSKCRLYGKIQWVDAFPDVKVQIVDAFPDIKVKFVDAFPDRPGTWQVVDAFPDFKVQKVSAFPDYKIQIVDAFPGCD